MRALLTALLVLFPAGALSVPPRAQPLLATGGWVWAVAPGVPDTSAFMTLRNTGKAAVLVRGGRIPVAGMVMPMTTVTRQSGSARMSGMANTAALTVPPGGRLTLRPDGDHLMLMGLKRSLKPGETLTLTLDTSVGALTVPLTVKKP